MSLRKLSDGESDVIFTVITSEEDDKSNEITKKPVEDGAKVSDHISNEPISLHVKGAVTKRPDSEQAYLQLFRFWRDRKLLKYSGRVELGRCQIEKLTTYRDKNIADGFEFDMILKQIKFAKKQEVKINTQKLNIPDIETLKEELAEEQSAKKTKVKEKTNAGTKGKKKTKERQLDKIKRMY